MAEKLKIVYETLFAKGLDLACSPYLPKIRLPPQIMKGKIYLSKFYLIISQFYCHKTREFLKIFLNTNR